MALALVLSIVGSMLYSLLRAYPGGTPQLEADRNAPPELMKGDRSFEASYQAQRFLWDAMQVLLLYGGPRTDE